MKNFVATPPLSSTRRFLTTTVALLSATLLGAPLSANEVTAQGSPFLSEIVFLDPLVLNHEALLSGVRPGIEVKVLDRHGDGIRQVANYLRGRSQLRAVHIVSHANSASLRLGQAQLSPDTISTYSTELASIGKAMATGGDLVLYGCDLASGPEGAAFVRTLGAATGADVSASTNLTGAARQGGDWVQEYATGQVEAQCAFSESARASFSGVLAPKLFFQARSYNEGGELRSFDGSSVNLISDIYTGGTPGTANGSAPASLTVYGGKLYFSASDAAGRSLWAYDGATNTTTRISALAANSSPTSIRVFNGKLYFSADNADGFGRELYAYDGTNLTRVADINAGAGHSTPSDMVVVGNKMYFAATTAAAGNELYVYDGTTVTSLGDRNAGANAGYSGYLTAVNGVLYYVGANRQVSTNLGMIDDTELWSYNPSTLQFKLAADMDGYYQSTTAYNPSTSYYSLITGIIGFNG
ncbi:MAG TPA: DUF4347 domain-containing protein, partial [Abditibacteriaceae bacterium]